MTTPIYDQLLALYRQVPERSINEDLEFFLRHGYVFSSPDHLLIGCRIEDAWFIHAAIGRGALRKFFDLMPYYLPYVGWARPQRGRKTVVWHSTDRLKKLLCKSN